ncbi:MAG: DUF4493 domain-containing protein [Phocaeicola sp.]
MRQTITQLFVAVLLCSVITACTGQSIRDSVDGMGVVSLKVALHDQINVNGHSLTQSQEKDLIASCEIKLYSEKGLIRRYQGLGSVPDTLQLLSGHYTLFVVAGDSLPASFSTKYYQGQEAFTITQGHYETVRVNCLLQNVVTSVQLSDELLQLIEPNYSIKLYTAAGNDTLLYTSDNIDKLGYFMPAAGITQLGWSFTAQLANNSVTYLQDGVIQSIEKSTHYALNFKTIEEDMNDGGAWLALQVDRTAIQVDNEVGVFQPPTLWGDGFNLQEPIRYIAPSNDSLTLWIATSSAIELATLTCSQFPEWGVASSVVNLMNYSADGFLTTALSYAPTSSTNYLRVTLEPALMEQITSQDGSYTLSLEAKGAKDQLVAHASLQLIVSTLSFATNSIQENLVYTNRATLTGTLLAPMEELPRFRYRIKGESTWLESMATATNEKLSASITSLSSGTTYQYQLFMNEEDAAGIEEFTTEFADQLPNSGFESYHRGSNNCYLFYPAGGALWWDSGNHGSITMNKNVTTPDTQVYNQLGNGQNSLKLQSQFVGILGIGKFAAGNLFAGKYLKTDGTDGILGFGQPWSSRPKLLVGYLRYQSGTVDYASQFLEKGASDIGSVYIALGDWTPVEEQGELWPIVIKTKASERQLFDPNPETNAGLIAYGELDYHQSTAGMIYFEIPLTYFDNRKPTAIAVVASASKYGDYFSGSTSSVLWIDDLELIYE